MFNIGIKKHKVLGDISVYGFSSQTTFSTIDALITDGTTLQISSWGRKVQEL